jgi:hypothetical protein
VLVLTTHSMEEADVLGDRIAVFAGGKLRCLGTALHLKAKHGQGYRLSVGLQQKGGGDSGTDDGGPPGDSSGAVAGASRAAVEALVQQVLGCQVAAHEAGESGLQFQLPGSCRQRLPQLLQQLQDRAQELGVAGVQVRGGRRSTLGETWSDAFTAAQLQATDVSQHLPPCCCPRRSAWRLWRRSSCAWRSGRRRSTCTLGWQARDLGS